MAMSVNSRQNHGRIAKSSTKQRIKIAMISIGCMTSWVDPKKASSKEKRDGEDEKLTIMNMPVYPSLTRHLLNSLHCRIR